MPDSYFVTYGNDRVCLAGTPGAIAWEYPSATVFLHPGYTANNDYLKMRFVTPEGGEIIIEDGSAGNVSASAMVPVNSTAYWTANGAQGESASYHVVSLGDSGFSGMSAYTAVTTGFYTNPDVESYGSAVLTATGSASAKTNSTKAWKATYGEGGTAWYTRVSASSWAGDYSGPWGTAGGNVMWIPSGAKVVFSASSVSGKTYTVQPAYTAMPGYEIVYAHSKPGTHSTVSGYMNSSYAFRLGSGRTKNVYATGLLPRNTSATASAAEWRPSGYITAFSSNLSTGSALDTFMVGTANIGKVYGFASSNNLGAYRDSAGTWHTATSGNTYKWTNVTSFISNSAKISVKHSAIRTKGATGNATAYFRYYGMSAGNMYNILSGNWKFPTASGNTATNTQTAANSTTVIGDRAFFRNDVWVAGNTALCVNASGSFTASGVIA